jgi:Tol biopolymer transport system component/DNA-binding winged helix-turn-helix (wHTH) protein
MQQAKPPQPPSGAARPTPVDPRGYAFGPFLVDPVRRLLWHDHRVVTLTGKTFDLLLILVRHRDRIVSKDELLRQIWHDVPIQENNLVRQMSNLRRALEQRPDQHDYVVTISGRGYRFVGPVIELAGLPADLPLSATDPRVDALPGAPAARTADAGVTSDGPSREVPGNRRWSAVAALAAVTVLGMTAYLAWPRRPAEPNRTLRQFTYDAGLQLDPTWAPDGRRVAYASDREGNSDIWIQSTADPTPIQLTKSSAADWQPHWSPDGKTIVFRSERDGGGLYVISVDGGEERRLSSFGFRPEWSPDGSRVLFTDTTVQGLRQTIHVIGRDGGQPERVRADLTDRARVTNAGWLPDGRLSLLFRDRSRWKFVTATIGKDDAIESAILPAVASRLADVIPGRFRWATSGRFLFFEGQAKDVSNLWRVTVDAATLSWTAAQQLTVGASLDSGLALSADGSRLAYASMSERTRLWAFPYSSATARLTGDGVPVTSGGPGEYDAAAPPDGTRLAYRTLRTGRQELWEHTLESGRDRLLLASNDRLTSPRWSRDGTRLAYLRGPAEGPKVDPGQVVAILPRDGGPETVVRMASGDRFVPDDWSPDGSLILGACSVGKMQRLGTCIMPVEPQGQIAQLKLLASDPNRALICQRFSPDQRWISFMAVSPGKVSRLYVMPATGGDWVPLTDGSSYDDKPRWSGDGRTVFFVSDRGGLLNLWARRFDPIAGQPLGEAFAVTAYREPRQQLTPNLNRTEIAVSTDRVFLPISESSGRIWILDHVDR